VGDQEAICASLVYAGFVFGKKHTRATFQVLERQVGNMNYPVGDFLIRIKNTARAGGKEFEVANTKLIYNTATCLVRMGYLNEVKKVGNKLQIKLAYRSKAPALMDLKLVTKPGLRVYAGVDELEKRRKPSTLVISTPEGILSLKEAVKKRVGGEVLAEVL
jgi:small subunit ribosomal protein S8